MRYKSGHFFRIKKRNHNKLQTLKRQKSTTNFIKYRKKYSTYLVVYF